MAADCIFCEIAQGRRDASIVLADDHSLAFLDHRPLFPGHCLLIPKLHFETLADLPASGIQPLFAAAQLLAEAVVKGLGAEGSFVAINNRISQSVPHLHVHVVPRRKKDGLKGFFWPRGKYTDSSECEAIRETLATAVDSLKASRHK